MTGEGIALVVYLAGIVVAVWPIFLSLGGEDEQGTEYRVMGGLLAGCLALFWPLFLAGGTALLISRRIWRGVFDVASPERHEVDR